MGVVGWGEAKAHKAYEGRERTAYAKYLKCARARVYCACEEAGSVLQFLPPPSIASAALYKVCSRMQILLWRCGSERNMS